MVEASLRAAVPRRNLILMASAMVACRSARASDDDATLLEQLLGKMPTDSDRIHLALPKAFPNGYTVPLSLLIDSPMTDADYVKKVLVVAPKNPLVQVVAYHFTPSSGLAFVSTRVRLAGPQFVLAAAEMSDGVLLMSKAWVDVATDGCQ